jgi:hypothetical protein
MANERPDAGAPRAPAPLTLTYADLPGLFQAADLASGGGQQQFFRSTGARLWLAIIAAISGAVSIPLHNREVNGAALVTVLAFVGALAIDVFDLRARPAVGWYEGRALAESIKTLAWRYAVGGAPFPIGGPDDDTDSRFADRLSHLLHDLPAVVTAPSSAPPISPAMRTLRAALLPERQQAYLAGRIGDQQRWYAGRAAQHARRTNRLHAAALALEVIGVAAALGSAVNLVQFDLAGIVAAVIAAVAAWSAAKQYQTTAAAYTVASYELGLIQIRLDRTMSETDWSRAVADAEEAVSREHTTWRASHRD